MTTSPKTDIKPTSQLEQQIEYSKRLAEQGFDYGFAIGEAFIQSMRNTLYKHTGTALDELVDNAIEAGATQVSIALHGDKKPDALAVIDDGHGMPRKMLRPAAAWGGTHRHQDETRTGLGRFGFGLPSASVNQAKCFTIYSKVDGGDWFAVTIDLEKVAKEYTDKTGKVHVPQERAETPPAWVSAHAKKHIPGGELEHGTVVLWERLDRITWTTTKGLRDNLLQHFGVTYRNYLQQTGLKFDGTRIEPLDPLFITPGCRFYDEDEDRAIALEPAEIEVKSKRTGAKAVIRIRYASFPVGFYSKDKNKAAVGNNALNRMKVARDNRGLIICRMGRQIDVVERTPWKNLEKFGNDDRYWAAEIDFPADLDEEFSIANTKQGVVMSDRVWELLDQAGMPAAIRSLRRMYIEAKKARDAEEENPNVSRASESSMAESEKHRRPRAGGNSTDREKRAKEAFEQYVKQKAKTQSRPEEQVRSEAEEEVKQHPYKVEFASHPGAPFYQVTQRGGMKVLEINRAHRFFSDVYAAAGSNRFLRAGLEVLLFSIGEAEIDAWGNHDKESFYLVEKAAWSERLQTALTVLDQFVHHTDTPDEEAQFGEEAAAAE